MSCSVFRRAKLPPGAIFELKMHQNAYAACGEAYRAPRPSSWFSRRRFAARNGRKRRGRKGRRKMEGIASPLLFYNLTTAQQCSCCDLYTVARLSSSACVYSCPHHADWLWIFWTIPRILENWRSSVNCWSKLILKREKKQISVLCTTFIFLQICSRIPTVLFRYLFHLEIATLKTLRPVCWYL